MPAELDWEALSERLRGARELLEEYESGHPSTTSLDHLCEVLTCLTLRVIQFAQGLRDGVAPAVYLVPLTQIDAAILLAERIARPTTPPEAIDRIIAEHGRRARERRNANN